MRRIPRIIIRVHHKTLGKWRATPQDLSPLASVQCQRCPKASSHWPWSKRATPFAAGCQQIKLCALLRHPKKTQQRLVIDLRCTRAI